MAVVAIFGSLFVVGLICGALFKKWGFLAFPACIFLWGVIGSSFAPKLVEETILLWAYGSLISLPCAIGGLCCGIFIHTKRHQSEEAQPDRGAN
jgi:hypothetical protein